MVALYIPLILVGKKYRPQKSFIFISFSIFTALYLFTGLIGVNSYNSFWGSLERMGGIFSFMHFWVYFVILVGIIKGEADWNKILKISVFVGLLSILFAYGQRFIRGQFFIGWQHGERVIGTIGNPALFAGYLIFILYIALYLFFNKDISRWHKKLYLAIFILGIPILLMTAVRGAVIAFFGSLFLLMVFLLFKSENKKIKKYLIAMVVIFVLAVLLIGLNRNQEWVKKNSILNRLSDISIGTSTIQTRLWSWESGINGWKERPIFGWGPENFMYLHMKYFDSRHFSGMGAETIWDRAHNMVLEVLSTMGVVGLISYLSIFFFIFYFLIKGFKKKKISVSIFGVLSVMVIAYFVQNLFIFDTFVNYFMFFLVLGYINFLNSQEVNSSAVALAREDEHATSKDPSIVLTAFLIIIALVAIFQLNIKPAKANYATTRAILAGRAGEVNRALAYYQKAIKYNTPQGNYELRHKLATFAVQVVEHQRATGKDFDANVLYYSIEQVKKNVERFPLDTSPYLYLGRMYILLIDKDPQAGDLAEENINKAIKLNDNNPRIWYELGQAQLSRKKYQESYQSFKKALELNPKVVISYWFMGSAAYYVGNYQEAVFYLEQALKMGYVDYKESVSDLIRMIKIYNEVGEYYKIIVLYKLAIDIQPNNPQFRASIAIAYAKVGNFEMAIQEARKAGEIDPKFKDEAERFIKSLPK